MTREYLVQRDAALRDSRGGRGLSRLSRSVIILSAADWTDARSKALKHGNQLETTYVGATGAQVRWRLMAVETLDELGESLSDGREIYSEPLEPTTDDGYPFDAQFTPEISRPGQSGV